MIQKRVAARDPEGINVLAHQYKLGLLGFKKNESRAFELFTEAAELGSTTALSNMAIAYYNGWGVVQDKAKGLLCFESAAMQGVAMSRHTLGLFESEDGNYTRAVRHFLVSAKLGLKESLDMIKDMFANGVATKAQFAEALKVYQDAVEEMKSADREEAEKMCI